MFQLHEATKGHSKSNAVCSFHRGKVNNGNDYWEISAIYLPCQQTQEKHIAQTAHCIMRACQLLSLLSACCMAE